MCRTKTRSETILIFFSERRGDETLPNFIKGKQPRKGEKKKQGARTKVQ
jgi:hypothetical protein